MTDLYGFRENGLNALKAVIEMALGIQMAAHESFYLGGDYYLAKLPDGIEISLQRNRDLRDAGPRYDDFPNIATLLFVSSPTNVNTLHGQLACIEGIRYLQRTTLTPDGKLSVERIESGWRT